jgi:hypothetical protein
MNVLLSCDLSSLVLGVQRGSQRVTCRETRIYTRAHGHGLTDQLAHAGATAAAAVPDFDTGTRAAGSSTRFSTTTPTGKAVVSDKTLHTPVFLNTTLHGITHAGPCRGHASTLRLGPLIALEPTPEKGLKNFKLVFLSESCSWAGFKSEATPPAHEYFAPRVPNPAQEQSPNAAPAALVVCNLPRACS